MMAHCRDCQSFNTTTYAGVIRGKTKGIAVCYECKPTLESPAWVVKPERIAVQVMATNKICDLYIAKEQGQ
ncbi:MAG: hypothetical protein H6Q67_1491 [Firmicutes bacterium]|nr:hypothetical protein [Bacillota bacterium]